MSRRKQDKSICQQSTFTTPIQPQNCLNTAPNASPCHSTDHRDAELLRVRVTAGIARRHADDAAQPQTDDARTEPKEFADDTRNLLLDLRDRSIRIESLLQTIIQQRAVKESYTTTEVAELLGKAEFTVREWCRLGRIQATKRRCGRGDSKEWSISHAEVDRIRNEGLLPQPRCSTRIR